MSIRKSISTGSLLLLVAGLCVGCGRSYDDVEEMVVTDEKLEEIYGKDWRTVMNGPNPGPPLPRRAAKADSMKVRAASGSQSSGER